MEDKRNIQNIRAMKQVLAKKLKDEETYFTYKDISIRTRTIKTDRIRGEQENYRGYEIVIKDYETTPFFMFFEEDDYFGYIVWIFTVYNNQLDENVEFVDSKVEYDVERALIHLGYYIGTRF